MPTDDRALRLSVLTEVALLGSLRRELGRSATPELHAGDAVALAQLAGAGPMRLGDLAAGLHVDISVVSRQVAELVAAGLVERRPDPADRRACRLEVTGQGSELLEQVRGRFEARFRAALSSWRPADLERVAADLHRLRTDLLSCGERDQLPAAGRQG